MRPCRRTAPAPDPRGFTLLELLVTISLFSIFMGAVYEVVLVGLRAVNAGDDRETVRLQLAKALDSLTREGALASNVDNAEDQRFQFDADLDANGTTENDINYQVNSGDLQRIYSGSTVTLVPDLTSLDCNYVDLNGATMTPPVTGSSRDNIRLVQVTMTAMRDNETISVSSTIYLRNNS